MFERKVHGDAISVLKKRQMSKGDEVGFLAYLTIALSIIWVASEARINVARRPGASAAVDDRRSHRLLTISTLVSIVLGLAIKLLADLLGGPGRIVLQSASLGYVGCSLMVGGMALRWAAIATLKDKFTVDVAIVQDHRIVDTGLYSVVRHPSYLGSLITFVGLGLAWENWLSLVLMIVLRLVATLYRISVEERVLVNHFGDAYQAYRKRTKGLVPGII